MFGSRCWLSLRVPTRRFSCLSLPMSVILPPCEVVATNCIECSQVAPLPSSSATIVATPRLGWDSGATSIDSLSGDIHTVFGVPRGVGGVAVGFRNRDEPNVTPSRVQHALYFQTLNGTTYVRVIEYGRYKTNNVIIADGDVFEIRRVAGVVTYHRNPGTVFSPLYTSRTPSSGVCVVNACLYASGDTVV